jgi:hypothetical protein
MTTNKDAIIEIDKPKSFKTKVTDDVNTESYHTSGMILFSYFSIWNICVFVEVIQMMNKPTKVRCINTPNGSIADDTSNSSACKSEKFRIIVYVLFYV